MGSIIGRYAVKTNDARPWIFLLTALFIGGVGTSQAVELKAGFARCDITPEKAVPMWGSGARRAPTAFTGRLRIFAYPHFA